MAHWDSADLFDRFLLHLGRGNGGTVGPDELWTAPRVWRALSDGQAFVFTALAPIVPNALVLPPFQMQTSDGGVTYTFGSAQPLAQIEVWAQETAGRELYATTYGNTGGDFVIDPLGIRMPGNRPRTFSSGPWARGVFLPSEISATVEPALQPAAARELILWRALEVAADLPGGEIDPRPWRERYAEAWDRWVLAWRRQYATHGGERRATHATGRWWLSLADQG
jgi:hypothetical protein